MENIVKILIIFIVILSIPIFIYLEILINQGK
jgi:hypothetical protein